MAQVILAVSGSLRKPSFTEKMLDLVLDGMGPDFEVHKFYPHRMKIGPCNSCWTCWTGKNPGECVQKDDFQQILGVYKRADFFLLAAPLYVFDFPATVKNMLDRFFVVLEPDQIQTSGGLTRHPTRFGRHPKTTLISSCGFPEAANFDLLSRHFKLICEHLDLGWAGEILIPAAGAANAPKLFDRQFELLRKAGVELAEGTVSEETMAALSAPVMSAEDYRRISTLSFERGLIATAKMVRLAIKVMRQQHKN